MGLNTNCLLKAEGSKQECPKINKVSLHLLKAYSTTRKGREQISALKGRRYGDWGREKGCEKETDHHLASGSFCSGTSR